MERCPNCQNLALLGDIYDCGHRMCRECLERRAGELEKFFCPRCNLDCEYFRIANPELGPYGEEVLVLNDVKEPKEEDLCNHTICLWCSKFKSQMTITGCGCNVCEKCIREEVKNNRIDDLVWCKHCRASLVGSFITKFGSFKIKSNGSLEMKRFINFDVSEVVVKHEIKQEPGLESTNQEEKPEEQAVIEQQIQQQQTQQQKNQPQEIQQQQTQQQKNQPPEIQQQQTQQKKIQQRRQRKRTSLLAPKPPLQLGAMMVIENEETPKPSSSGRRMKDLSEEEKERVRAQNRIRSRRCREKKAKALMEVVELRKELEHLKKTLF